MAGRTLDELPLEIVVMIFSFIPCSSTLGRLQRVCKTFREQLEANQNIWRMLCLKFWREKNFHAKVSLEGIFAAFRQLDTRNDWIWLAKCFAREKSEEGLGFRSFHTTAGRSIVSVGNMGRGKLQKAGMEIYLDGSTFYFGNFVDGKLHGKGVIEWEGGARYQGDWKDGHREGFGVYRWSNGDTYEGEFKHDGKKEGRGIFTYADGDRFEGFYVQDERQGWGRMEWKTAQFTFEGMFKHNEPADPETSLHPSIKGALKRQLCTGTVTGRSLHFGQYFHEFANADYCSACAECCVQQQGDRKSAKRWSDGTYCACVDQDSCQRREPVAKKVKFD